MTWRENLAKAIYDLGKIAFAALVVGQLVTPEGLQRLAFVLGSRSRPLRTGGAEAMDNLVILFSVGIAILVIVGVYFFIVDRKKAKSRS